MMSSMHGTTGRYQYSQGSKSNNQPINYGSKQVNEDDSIPQALYVERRQVNHSPITPISQLQYYTSNVQDHSIPQYLYVERRSTNPEPTTQYNQSQYIEANHSSFGYQNARAVQAQTSGMYHHKSPGTPSRNINPALKVNPPPLSQSQYAVYGKESDFIKKETRGEIDDSPIIDPSAFHYLNLNDKKVQKKTASSADDSGIDTRPIINLDAVTQLEKRRQQQIEKNNRLRGDDGSGAGIDGRSIVDRNAFRHIEAKVSKNRVREQKGEDNTDGVDNRPITNPDAFKHLEVRREHKQSTTLDESFIDTRPIINPDAFKYLEEPQETSSKDHNESGIDYNPIVNPDAFRYLEQRCLPSRREVESGVDTTSIVDPNAFHYIERREIPKPEKTVSSVDCRPIVNPRAFKWIEREEPKRRVDDGPDVDERSYINPRTLEHIDRRPGKKSDACDPEIDTRSFILDRNPNALAHLEHQSLNKTNTITESGVDERSYVNPRAFKYLEGLNDDASKNSVHSSVGPSIDTKSYVKPDAFRHLELKDRETQHDDTDDLGVDERSFVSLTVFRHLEFTGEHKNPEQFDYSIYGQSDL